MFHVAQLVWWKRVPGVIWEVFEVHERILGIRLDWGEGRYETHFVSYDEVTLIE
jgi:hypothetical protein